ncbi:MAG: isoleucine--tRNA ligase [Thermoplasmata archaeon]|nr:MAG: isoleucine--tRNA ligase [Thermoplasmata archaeon]
MMKEIEQYRPSVVEKEVLRFWEENEIFKKSVEKRKGCRRFVFLEGPPTANGTPHPGHVLTRIMKDVVLRYYTMKGFYVPRRAGWDTHGLPVEIEVEKKLGLKTKQDIEKYGIEKFNQECRKSTFRYENEWIEMTRRVGLWIDMDNPYITLENDYIESVWWSLKQLWEKGHLYKGYKVVPYCPRCGTALSAHEVAQGYKSVTEPSIFVKFKLKNENAYFLAWTTTPWTLLSNVALAVHPDEPYLKIKYRGEILILAEERVARLFKGEEYEILDRFMGKELEGKEYEPLFTYERPEKKAWYVICADFVTMDEGTGIVHIAPAFGEEDYEAGREYDLPVIQLVKKDGTFDEKVEPWKGMFVKDADPLIIKHLEERGLIFAVQDYTHDYPFCWRCDTPLLYYAMESWFIAVSKFRKQLVENNETVEWYPDHIKHGRFGDFISEAKDWALSRNRYWGTPLPIWRCKKCGNEICVGSVEELKKLSKEFPEKYDLHKPFVDNLEVMCPNCNSRMEREPYVIDCWYDSGSAFYAQWHYPFENQKEFEENFPVDFICEALDQTRGWFYSLMAISTLLFNRAPYRRVLTLGLVLDREGQKMSKSKKNYLDPNYIFDREGADAMRWYFLSTNAPWMPIRFYEDAIKETLGKFILTFWNSYRFYKSYSSLDKFDPTRGYIPIDRRREIDRWIISRLQKLIREVTENVENFNIHKATRAIEEFVIEDLSNWYIRRSRKRLWVEEENEDKLSCYSTLYDVFLALSKLSAPFIPFLAEVIYQGIRHDDMEESVHLCDYPEVNSSLIDEDMEKAMDVVREIADMGRAIRSRAGVKIRYPLGRAIVVCEENVEKKISPLMSLVKEEINVKSVEFSRDTAEYLKEIEKGDCLIEESEKIKLIMDVRLTPELFAEGFSREIVRRIQSMRKELNLDIEDRINTQIAVDEEKIGPLSKWLDYIRGETRSENIDFTDQPGGDLVKEWKIGDTTVKIGIKKIES